MSPRIRRAKRMLSLQPPEGESWYWVTVTIAGSITFRALGIHARRILDYLLLEHASHAGLENGNLGAAYSSLAKFGVTEDDIPKGLAELMATGFIRCEHRAHRVAAGGDPSRYAITWFPTRVGTKAEAPATHDWKRVLEGLHRLNVGNVKQAKAWLKTEIVGSIGGWRQKKRPTPHLRLVNPSLAG